MLHCFSSRVPPHPCATICYFILFTWYPFVTNNWPQLMSFYSGLGGLHSRRRVSHLTGFVGRCGLRSSKLVNRLKERGFQPKLHILDNETSSELEEAIVKNEMTFQYVAYNLGICNIFPTVRWNVISIYEENCVGSLNSARHFLRKPSYFITK